MKDIVRDIETWTGAWSLGEIGLSPEGCWEPLESDKQRNVKVRCVLYKDHSHRQICGGWKASTRVGEDVCV